VQTTLSHRNDLTREVGSIAEAWLGTRALIVRYVPDFVQEEKRRLDGDLKCRSWVDWPRL
jgi:hypothetical protein